MVKGAITLPGELAPLVHGGDLGAARRLFPGAHEPFVDLSTGINPNPYPVQDLPADAFTKLPEPAELSRLIALAAEAYGAPSPEHVVAAPGSQILMALAAARVTPGTAAVLGPTYAEHARAARLGGHEVVETGEIEHLADGDLAIVVNPNNPDGKAIPKRRLLGLAEQVKLLVVDEAFIEAGSQYESLAADMGRGNIVVLRSFGKFFGLPGLRMSFAIAEPGIAAWLRAALGPWPVSGAALAIGTKALADKAWMDATRTALAASARKLDALLTEAALDIVGGTNLFRLVQSENAAALFTHLGKAGILVRRFEEQPTWLRFGLPGGAQDWQRLETALRSFSDRS